MQAKNTHIGVQYLPFFLAHEAHEVGFKWKSILLNTLEKAQHFE